MKATPISQEEAMRIRKESFPDFKTKKVIKLVKNMHPNTVTVDGGWEVKVHCGPTTMYEAYTDGVILKYEPSHVGPSLHLQLNSPELITGI